MLLAHDYAHATPPTLGKADAHYFHLGCQITQQFVGGRMKTEGRRCQVNQGSRRLQWHAGKISVARQIAPFQVMPHVPPVTGGLQGQVDMLRRF